MRAKKILRLTHSIVIIFLNFIGPDPITQLRSVDDSVDDSEREKRAAEHHTYQFELWVWEQRCFWPVWLCSASSGAAGGKETLIDLRERLRIVEEFVEEEAKKRRARWWSTMHCLTEIDNRMTAHEETCLTTLRDLESSIEHLA
ncbi:hypothetical protein OUZ56_011305 [Daphnia magna]|uniref:Uncharacterized protein n=1 Tax=Daphnia magna TaxID=35525 RepID=A0ABQ9YZS6_9CRUS|nr:hypothetical protein OUZ56_011305 [Daphnia magna]